MSDFVHEPVPQVVIVVDPNTGENVAVEQVNSDFFHPSTEQVQDMAELKAKQLQERADLIQKQHEELHTDEDGNVLLSDSFIQARDEGDGQIVIPKPPEKVTTRPATEEELENFVPYRASTPDQEKAAVDDLVQKRLITEERADQWKGEIDSIAEDVPAPDDGTGISVAAKDEGQFVSPPPYSQINNKDFSEAKTEDPNSTPATTPRDTDEGTVTVSPDDSVDPRPTEVVTNIPTEGVNVPETNVNAEKVIEPESNTASEAPVLKLGE